MDQKIYKINLIKTMVNRFTPIIGNVNLCIHSKFKKILTTWNANQINIEHSYVC